MSGAQSPTEVLNAIEASQRKEVAVLKADGGELAGLAVGRADDKVAYVRSKSSTSIYAVDAKSLEDIRKAPTDIPG